LNAAPKEIEVETAPHIAPIIRTKLHRPPIGEGFVCRERLHRVMDRALEKPLTLVSAPAGYGKSILVSHWAESLEQSVAWLSLDPEDSDLDSFVRYLLAAVGSVLPNACPETQALITASVQVPTATLCGCLANELDAIDTPLVLVLDDYHRIAPDSEVQELLQFLLEHPPLGLRLVLVTRIDPPLPIPSLRGSGSVVEIRLLELRFTTAECSEYLEIFANLQPGPDALGNLEFQLEGWAVGLRLVAMCLQHKDDPDVFLKQLRGGLQQTREYLFAEVIERLPSETRDCMIRLSILDRFCPELIDALCGHDNQPLETCPDGRQLVAKLVAENLFVVSLDEQGQWFRFHHTFQDELNALLQASTDLERVRALHVRASEWLEKEGFIDTSIRHAIQARDLDRATGIFGRHWRAAQDDDRWRDIEKWYDLMPEEVLGQRPGLLLAHTWLQHYRFEIDKIPATLKRLEKLAERRALDDMSAGEMELFQGVMLFWTGQLEPARQSLLEAQNLLASAHQSAAGLTQIYLAMTQQMLGEGQVTVRELNSKIEAASQRSGKYLANLAVARCFVYLLCGELTPLKESAWWITRFAEPLGGVYLASYEKYMKGLVCLHGGNPEGAVKTLAPLREWRRNMHSGVAIDAMTGLALAQQAMQQGEAAIETMNQVMEFAAELQNAHHLSVARSAQARLHLARGELEPALRWLRSFDEPPFAVAPLWWLETPSLTQARVLVAAGTEENLEQAVELLRTLGDVAQTQHNHCQVIDILALQALALEQLGRTKQALEVLKRAVILAEPGRWVRPFTEPGDAMAPLLKKLEAGHEEQAYANELLRFFPTQALSARASPPINDPLTPREAEILDLLARRLQDKEIARHLSISPQTVNSHLKNIYQKLNVANRRQAVAQASALGL